MDDLKINVKDIIDDVYSINLLDTSDIPRIDLYMEQVTSFFDETMGDLRRKEDDKILTKTMVNNYTKHEILPHPIKKKYTREHMVALTYIVALKKILSIQDIKAYFELAKDDEESLKLEPTYNVFKELMERNFEEVAQSLDEKLDDIDNILLENGMYHDSIRLMTFIATICYEASAYKLLAGKLIDRFQKPAPNPNEKEKTEK